jgi:hypothetical protein
MYGEPIDKVMKEARAEYERIVKSKSKTESISNKNEINMKETAKAAQLIQTTQSNQPNQTNWLMILVSFIAVGTLINAVLMSFILYELKKKD